MKNKIDKKARRKRLIWYYIYRYLFMPNHSMKAFLWGAEKPNGHMSKLGRRSFIAFCQDIVALSTQIEAVIGLNWSGFVLACLLVMQDGADGLAWFFMTLFLIIPIGLLFLVCACIIYASLGNWVVHVLFRFPD